MNKLLKPFNRRPPGLAIVRCIHVQQRGGSHSLLENHSYNEPGMWQVAIVNLIDEIGASQATQAQTNGDRSFFSFIYFFIYIHIFDYYYTVCRPN